ncbi:MAG: DUF4194 domain-containing protein [Firmicutes bacterium]|nr:DUF4194 domain-containing protein [Bacillota bacterium]
MWALEWEQLGDKDREQFARVANLLWQKTFLVREEVDARSRNMVINRDYRFLERYSQLFREYFRLTGWDIQLDSHFGVVALYNRLGYNHRRLDKQSTYFLYVLRLIYEEQLEKLTLRKEVTTTVGRVVEKMFHLALLDRKPADKQLREGLAALRACNIIDRLDGPWTHPETRIIIYPSILLLVSNEKISELYAMLEASGKLGGGDEDDETTAEDAHN